LREDEKRAALGEFSNLWLERRASRAATCENLPSGKLLVSESPPVHYIKFFALPRRRSRVPQKMFFVFFDLVRPFLFFSLKKENFSALPFYWRKKRRQTSDISKCYTQLTSGRPK
jgi:hypothetical protein